MIKSKLYVAGPLFSEAEKRFNKQLKNELSAHFDVYLPQEDGLLVEDMVKNGVPFLLASQKVFYTDINAIN